MASLGCTVTNTKYFRFRADEFMVIACDGIW